MNKITRILTLTAILTASTVTSFGARGPEVRYSDSKAKEVQQNKHASALTTVRSAAGRANTVVRYTVSKSEPIRVALTKNHYQQH